MNLTPGTKYKVMETPQAIVIVREEHNVTDGHPLVIADTPDLNVWLSVYMKMREAGRSMEAAKEMGISAVKSGLVL